MCKTFILDSKEDEKFIKLKRGLFLTHPILGVWCIVVPHSCDNKAISAQLSWRLAKSRSSNSSRSFNKIVKSTKVWKLLVML